MDYDKLPYAAKALTALGAGMGQEGTTARQMGVVGMDMADSAIMRQQMEKQRKEQEKKQKSSKLGNLGSIAGTILGAALAPATGGASLALASGLGSGLGSIAGQAVEGGGIDYGAALKSGLMSGATAGLLGPASNAAKAGQVGGVATTAPVRTLGMIPEGATLAAPAAQAATKLPSFAQFLGDRAVSALNWAPNSFGAGAARGLGTAMDTQVMQRIMGVDPYAMDYRYGAPYDRSSFGGYYR